MGVVREMVDGAPDYALGRAEVGSDSGWQGLVIKDHHPSQCLVGCPHITAAPVPPGGSQRLGVLHCGSAIGARLSSYNLDSSAPPGGTMGLFKSKPILCPICDDELDRTAALRSEHWLQHVQRSSGGFTWKCACGRTRHEWSRDIKAAGALGVHMARMHHISFGDSAAYAASIALGDMYDGMT